ncbi:MAG: hypothetical protein CM1200mP18_11730 [Gammaproteobacteria bacterium]|nr:MAG: hypothetical protein CM1200mP18_11730 [Gammaproteobacteria bacterium]
MTFVFDCQQAVAHHPLTLDISGVTFRPEGAGYIALLAPGPDENPWSFDFDIDYTVFNRRIWPALAQRIPAFEAIKLKVPGLATWPLTILTIMPFLVPTRL